MSDSKRSKSKGKRRAKKSKRRAAASKARPTSELLIELVDKHTKRATSSDEKLRRYVRLARQTGGLVIVVAGTVVLAFVAMLVALHFAGVSPWALLCVAASGLTACGGAIGLRTIRRSSTQPSDDQPQPTDSLSLLEQEDDLDKDVTQ